MKYRLCAAAFITAFIFVPLSSSANPFVDPGANGRAARGAPHGTLPPPLPDYSPSQPALNEEPDKDINILGFIGKKVVVSVNGKVSAVKDGAEIGGCLIAYPEILCSEREKEKHRKGRNPGKTKEGNAAIKEKTPMIEKGAVVPGGLP